MSHEVPTRTSVKALLQYEGASENLGNILVLREKTGDNSGKYHFPGGHVEEGESLEEALRRELREETSIEKVEIDQSPYFQCEWPAKFGGEVIRVVGQFYVCKTEQEAVILSPEHDHALWMPPKDYQLHPMVSHSEQIIEEFLKTRGQMS